MSKKSMKTDDRFLWIPMIALLLGIGLPGFFFDFDEGRWQQKIWLGIFTSMAMFVSAIFKKFGRKYSKIQNWAAKHYNREPLAKLYSIF